MAKQPKPQAPRRLVTAACLRGSHKACRGRALNPDASTPKERWLPCTCPCPHDRGDGCLAYAKAEAEGDLEKMAELARDAATEPTR